MAYSFVFFRDRIVLNNDLKQRIKLDSTPLGSQILLAAREFVVDGPFTLDGRDLVILADRFDGAQGTMALQGLIPGTAGPKVTIACRAIAGLTITSTGAEGDQGAEGGPGAEGKPGRPASLPFKPGGPGGPGGRGKTGGRGRIGGPGGDITDRLYRRPGPGRPRRRQHPGPRRPRRPRWPRRPRRSGRRGRSRRTRRSATAPTAPKASPAPKGRTACPAPCRNPKWTKTGYFQVLQSLADQWAAYRLRVAEYYYRAFNPSGPPTSTYLDLAFAELRAVLQLDPQNVQAAAYVNQILNNQNVLGLARELDIIPDFPYYEQVLADYGPLVLSLFQSANSFLLGNLTLDQLRQTLTREIAHLEGLKLALEAEQAAAIRGKQVAETEQQFARTRVLDIQDRIQARREELENRRIDWGGVLTFGVFAVGAGIVALATGGAGAGMLLAYLPDFLALAGADFGPIPGKDQADILGKARGLKDYTAAKNNLPNTVMPLVVSFAKMLSDLSEAQGDAEMIQLLREATELTHAQLLAQLRNDQAGFALDAATAHLAQAVQDLELARTQLGEPLHATLTFSRGSR